MMEEWREHKSGLLVSNLGQVFVPKNHNYPEHYTYGSLRTDDYLTVYYNKKRHLVHDLVYETFHNIELNNLEVVHHINGNRKDNRLENLIVLSEEEHKRIHGIERSKQVLQYDLNGNFIREWSSIMEIQRQLGYIASNITACCKGKRKTAHKYIWKYKE